MKPFYLVFPDEATGHSALEGCNLSHVDSKGRHYDTRLSNADLTAMTA